MVIRFDRAGLPEEAPDKSHYNGFILPNDAVFSELLAILPERSDLLSVRGVVWRIEEAEKKKRTVGYIGVDREGSYTLRSFCPSSPCSGVEKGRITAECIFRGGYLIGDGRFERETEKDSAKIG